MIRAPTFNTPKQSYTACLASCSGTSKTMMWPCGVHREKYIRDYCIIYCYCRWWYWSRKKNCCWWEKIWLESPRSMQRTKAKLHYKRHCLPGMNQNDNDVATWSPQGKYIRDYHILYCYCRWWCWSGKEKWLLSTYDHLGPRGRKLGEGSCMDLQYAIFYKKIYFPWLPL